MAGKRNTVTIPRTYKSGAHRVRAIYATDQEIGLLGALDGRTENQYGPGGLLVLAPPRGGPHQDSGVPWSFDDPYVNTPDIDLSTLYATGAGAPDYFGDPAIRGTNVSGPPVGGHHLGEGAFGGDPWESDASTWDIGDIFTTDVDHDPNAGGGTPPGGGGGTPPGGGGGTPPGGGGGTPPGGGGGGGGVGSTVVVDTRTGTLRRIPFGMASLAQRTAWTHPMSMLDYETPSMQAGGLWEGIGAEYQPGTTQGLGLISEALRTPYQAPTMSDIPPGWMGSGIEYDPEPQISKTEEETQQESGQTASEWIDWSNRDAGHYKMFPNLFRWNGFMWVKR